MLQDTTSLNSETVGLAPGTVVYVGEKNNHSLKLETYNYERGSFERLEFTNIKELANYKRSQKNTWISINGLNHTDVIEQIGSDFNLHPLILEDIANTHQRPKIDEFSDYMFIVLKMLSFDAEENLCFEHISFVLGVDYLITFQESDSDVFDGVRKRLKLNKGRIRETGTDYLLYLLMDAVIDNYFHISEGIGEKIEEIEDSLFIKSPEADKAQEIHDLKREVLKLRRTVFPVRELVKRIEKTESKLLTDKTQFYLRDLLDHTIQISENIDIYREMVSGLMDMYMSTISNKMNEVMKVLTIIATIFIPLTFIAGIYGINFEYMPELQFKYAYHILITIMVGIFLGLLFFFRKKKWL